MDAAAAMQQFTREWQRLLPLETLHVDEMTQDGAHYSVKVHGHAPGGMRIEGVAGDGWHGIYPDEQAEFAVWTCPDNKGKTNAAGMRMDAGDSLADLLRRCQ